MEVIITITALTPDRRGVGVSAFSFWADLENNIYTDVTQCEQYTL